METPINSEQIGNSQQAEFPVKRRKNYPEETADARKYVRAFITAFNFPSTLDELLNEYLLEEAYLDIETLLYKRFREGRTIEWTVPKWAKPGDICLFYFAKMADEKLRRVQKEFELRINEFDFPVLCGLDMLLRRGWEYYDNYSGTILAIGKVAGMPYYYDQISELSHFKSPLFAEIQDITTLAQPLHISDFKDVVFITRGGTITPVFGREFDVIRDRITSNNKMPDYFINCSTKPIPLRNINNNNWMKIAQEYRSSFILEQEFRGCYVDYLLQGISDDGIVYRECRTKKTVKGKAKKGFVDNVILFNGKYLPVEVKLNIKSEAGIVSQCERYCHLDSLFTTKDTFFPQKKIYRDNVLIVDTVGVYLYSDQKREIDTIFDLNAVSQESLESIRTQIARSFKTIN